MGRLGCVDCRIHSEPFIDETDARHQIGLKSRFHGPECLAVFAIKIAVVRTGGHGGEVEFHREMYRQTCRQVLQLIAHIQGATCGRIESNRLCDFDRIWTEISLTPQNSFNAFVRTTEFCLIDSLNKIA